ncbi:MAG: hypothetical protein HY051_02035 [Candidatus Aenigmarchaeota archaeon]|nr:hypothetical protein [Candidatus Aenigmarchaeota archaeon]
MKIWTIASGHNKNSYQEVTDYLVKSSCRCLGVEYPSNSSGLIGEYVAGRLSYDELMKRVRVKFKTNFSDSQWTQVKERERPQFVGMRKLRASYPEFQAFAFETPGLFMKASEVDNDFYSEVTSDSPDIGKILAIYDKMVSIGTNRNKLDSQRIGKVAKSSATDVHISIGAQHAPFITLELKRMGYDSEMVLLSDFFIPPKDELIIRRSKGEPVEPPELIAYAERDIYFWKHYAAQVRRTGEDIGSMIDVQFDGTNKQKLFSELIKDLDV